MKRVRFTIEDLMEDLRQMNIFRIEDVEYAIVETNGKLSILPKPDQTPATAGMLNFPAGQRSSHAYHQRRTGAQVGLGGMRSGRTVA